MFTPAITYWYKKKQMLRIFRHQQQTKKNRKLKIQNSAVASASAEHCSRVYVPETGQAEDCWTKIDDFLYAILSFYSSDDDDNDHTHETQLTNNYG